MGEVSGKIFTNCGWGVFPLPCPTGCTPLPDTPASNLLLFTEPKEPIQEDGGTLVRTRGGLGRRLAASGMGGLNGWEWSFTNSLMGRKFPKNFKILRGKKPHPKL
jgi:hypothetical protein